MILVIISSAFLSFCDNVEAWFWMVLFPIASLLLLTYKNLKLLRTFKPRAQMVARNRFDWAFFLTYTLQTIILMIIYQYVWVDPNLPTTSTSTIIPTTATSTMPLQLYDGNDNDVDNGNNETTTAEISTATTTTTFDNLTTTIVTTASTLPSTSGTCPADGTARAVIVFNGTFAVLYMLMLIFSLSPQKLTRSAVPSTPSEARNMQFSSSIMEATATPPLHTDFNAFIDGSDDILFIKD